MCNTRIIRCTRKSFSCAFNSTTRSVFFCYVLAGCTYVYPDRWILATISSETKNRNGAMCLVSTLLAPKRTVFSGVAIERTDFIGTTSTVVLIGCPFEGNPSPVGRSPSPSSNSSLGAHVIQNIDDSPGGGVSGSKWRGGFYGPRNILG
jgi:hypothetical protein